MCGTLCVPTWWAAALASQKPSSTSGGSGLSGQWISIVPVLSAIAMTSMQPPMSMAYATCAADARIVGSSGALLASEMRLERLDVLDDDDASSRTMASASSGEQTTYSMPDASMRERIFSRLLRISLARFASNWARRRFWAS